MIKKVCIISLFFLLISTSLFCSEKNRAADKWLSKDKFSHLTSSTFLYCWHHEIFYNACRMKKNSSQVLAFSLTEFWGLIKEISDSGKKNNHFCYKDFIFDTLGCTIGFMICK